MPNLQLSQLKDIIGDPIILLQVYDPVLKRTVQLTLADLPPSAITACLAWVNTHMGNA